MTSRFVNVQVKSVQIDAAGKSDVIKTFAIGKKNFYKDKIYVSYEEPCESGLEKTTTLLKLEKGRLTLTRQGEIEQKLEFIAGRLTNSVYKMPFGVLKISVDTKALAMNFTEEQIQVELEYILLINDEMQGLTKLCILIGEDNRVGH